MKIKTDNTNTLLSEQRVIVRYFIMLNIFVKSLSSFTVANCLFFFYLISVKCFYLRTQRSLKTKQIPTIYNCSTMTE